MSPLDALTSLRFFAALAVVFYHSGAGFAANSRIAPTIVENILNNGWLGVPFFFILSGFILTYAHADMHFDRAQLRRFFAARFSRLYPVYILALLICIPFVDHFSFATDWFQFFLLQTWFPNSGATDWNFVAWTLSVEMLFYLVFPFAFVFFRRLSNRALLVRIVCRDRLAAADLAEHDPPARRRGSAGVWICISPSRAVSAVAGVCLWDVSWDSILAEQVYPFEPYALCGDFHHCNRFRIVDFAGNANRCLAGVSAR